MTEHDDFQAARGILTGLLVGLTAWMLIFLALWWALGKLA